MPDQKNRQDARQIRQNRQDTRPETRQTRPDARQNRPDARRPGATHGAARGDGGGPRPDRPADREEAEPAAGGATESDAARRRRRAQFLRELNEAKELRDRVQPRRARAARMRQQMRMRTFRW
ncbi:hypothetical protein AB0I82_23450 [Streptomyces sp. NPDC050315]|uniref:hypothetical protein n=1 Tax=Streptomyces sp. NPDC050315 TaxID=3155039 RepID=UPI003441AD0C